MHRLLMAVGDISMKMAAVLELVSRRKTSLLEFYLTPIAFQVSYDLF